MEIYKITMEARILGVDVQYDYTGIQLYINVVVPTFRTRTCGDGVYLETAHFLGPSIFIQLLVHHGVLQPVCTYSGDGANSSPKHLTVASHIIV